MSAWEDVKSGVRSVANKVICRTDELAEEASLSIKRKTAEAHLNEAYEKLGRACHPFLLQEGVDPRSEEAVRTAMEEVDKRRAELDKIDESIRRFHRATGKSGKTSSKGSGSSNA